MRERFMLHKEDRMKAFPFDEKNGDHNLPDVPTSLHTSREYNIGRLSFTDGQPDTVNPYPKGRSRVAWYTGYYDAQTEKKFGALFARNGV